MDGNNNNQFGTVLLVVGSDGSYRTTTDASSLQPGETAVGRGTCWAGDANSAQETGRTLLDRAGVVNGRKRW